MRLFSAIALLYQPFSIGCEPLYLYNVRVRSPEEGSILWGCQGRSPLWCCKEYLWAQRWYPYQINLPPTDPLNIAHLAKSVEPTFRTVDNPGGRDHLASEPANGDLRCLTTEVSVDIHAGQLMMSNRQLRYPCEEGKRLETWPAPSIRNPRAFIRQGICTNRSQRIFRMLVRLASRYACIRATAAIPYRIMQVELRTNLEGIGNPSRVWHGDPDVQGAILSIKDLTLSAEVEVDIRVDETGGTLMAFEMPLIGHEYQICAHRPKREVWLSILWIPMNEVT